MNIKKFKNIFIEVDEKGRPVTLPGYNKSIHATPLIGRSIEDVAKESLDVLYLFPEFDDISFKFSGMCGTLDVLIKRDYSYEDVEELVHGLYKIQLAAEEKKFKLIKKIEERIKKSLNKGV